MSFLSNVINVTKRLAEESANNTGDQNMAQKEGSMLNEIAGLFQTDGVKNIANKFQQKGLGDVFNSWVGTGNNKEMPQNQVKDVLGSDIVGKLAQKLGIDENQASQMMSQFLPNVVDQATPDGTIEE